MLCVITSTLSSYENVYITTSQNFNQNFSLLQSQCTKTLIFNCTSIKQVQMVIQGYKFYLVSVSYVAIWPWSLISEKKTTHSLYFWLKCNGSDEVCISTKVCTCLKYQTMISKWPLKKTRKRSTHWEHVKIAQTNTHKAKI